MFRKDVTGQFIMLTMEEFSEIEREIARLKLELQDYKDFYGEDIAGWEWE